MDNVKPRNGLHPGWWSAILVTFVVAFIYLTTAMFNGAFRSFVPVTLTAGRSGLVMESGAKVKMRGVEVGRVGTIHGGGETVSLELQLDPSTVDNIPANVTARIEATTAFGAKYVDLIAPADPNIAHITAGAVLHSDNVSVEVNTVFENLVSVLHQVQPDHLNATLAALAQGLSGQGQRIGQAISGANQVLTTMNAKSDTFNADLRGLKGFSDAYSAAAPDIIKALAAVSTTSTTVSGHAAQLDALLLNVTGLAHSGTVLLAPNNANLIAAVNNLGPTTDLLLHYNPELTCMLKGAENALPAMFASGGGNGRTAIVDAAILFGKDVYRYPDNLPKVNAHGGPGGKPSCGSLPDVSQNFPVKQLVTDTGWGTNPNEIRTNPGVGHPFWVDYFPHTRAAPEPPSYRGLGPLAPGPFPPTPVPPPPPNPDTPGAPPP